MLRMMCWGNYIEAESVEHTQRGQVAGWLEANSAQIPKVENQLAQSQNTFFLLI